MKKNYFSPEIATMDVQLTSVLCASGMDNKEMQNEHNSFGAPRRNVF